MPAICRGFSGDSRSVRQRGSGFAQLQVRHQCLLLQHPLDHLPQRRADCVLARKPHYLLGGMDVGVHLLWWQRQEECADREMALV